MTELADACAAWRESVAGAGDLDARWQAYEQGLELIERAASDGLLPPEGLSTLLGGLAGLRGSIGRVEQAPELLEQRLDYLEHRLSRLLADTGMPREEQVGALHGLLLCLEQMELLLDAGVEAGQLGGELRRLGREIERFAETAAEEAREPAARHAELARRSLEGQIAAALTDSRPEELTRTWRELAGLELLEEQCAARGMHARAAELATERSRRLTELEALLAGLPEEPRREFIERAALEERELVEEALTQIEDRPLAAATRTLELARERVELLARHRPAGGDAGARRALAFCRRRLFNEWVEKRIHEKLERRFGRRFVALLENAVLLLILAVCALLLGEAIYTLSTSQVVRLAYIDAAICVVFLFEFFLKLGHSPARWNYFRRHFLIDFLPSLPFGLVAVWAGAVGAGSHPSAVRAVRLARLPRLARYIRVARPLIRLGRIAIFALRGLDRVVRRYGTLINRNIVFFDPPDARERPDLHSRIAGLQLKLRGIVRSACARLPAPGRRRLLEARLRLAEARLTQDAGPAGEPPARIEPAGTREIRVEQVIEALVRLDADGLEEHFGPAFVRRVARVTQVASLPLLRRLPLLRDVARARGEARDEAELLTKSAHALGRGMERMLSTLYWLADLYGVVSAPVLVDRLGATLARATERPAKRLLLLGLVFGALYGLSRLVPWQQVKDLGGRVEQVLGLPLVVLGLICFLIMVLGRWFQRVAGQAGDFYSRAAEAQFLGLIKLVKTGEMDEHRRILERRILIPEAKVTGRRRLGTRIARELSFAERLAVVLDEEGKVEPGEAAERVALLYRHYLDGAPLHRSGSTTTNQLLGNLVLDNILKERLQLERKALKGLARLDLERSRSVFGPYLWFNFITLAIAQRTARLVVEYNIHAVPLEQRALYEERELAAIDAWLGARQAGARAPRGRLDLLYRTTAFTAVDFMTRDPRRDEAIERRFGEALAGQLRLERRQMLREVFGTFPFSRWPKGDRSINLYDLYWRHLGGARALVFPLVLCWKVLRLSGYLLRRLLRALADLLTPEQGYTSGENAVASYPVALRKINRMRKPVFMAATGLRARFDVEYMGLCLPGEETSGLEQQTYEEDLDWIGALQEECDEYLETKRRHRAALQTLAQYLEWAGWSGDGLARWLDERLIGERRRAREALRACAAAFAADYQQVASLTRLGLAIDEAIERALQSDDPPRRLLNSFSPRAIRLRRAFDRWWHKNRADRPQPERLRCRRAALADRRGLGALLLAARRHDGAPLEAARRVVERICQNPTTWTQQLLTIRTVQTLALLDVLSDRQIVRDLGEYEDAPEPPRPVVLPGL